MAYDFWAELVSPLKSDFRREFYRYAEELYRTWQLPLTAYIPAAMGGDMPPEDYLTHMPENSLPKCLLTMSYGECSHPRFAEKILSRGIYERLEAAAFFPELMVVDLARLGDRPVPERYEDLADEAYRGEISLIGSPRVPDPTVPLYIYRKRGGDALVRFARNVNAFAAPVNTIRHIGRKSNTYGSVFLMPSLFAFVCGEKPGARIVIPPDGAAAEPILLLSQKESEKTRFIRNFVFSGPVRSLFAKKCFPPAGDESIPIDRLCKEKLICDELPQVFAVLRENISCGSNAQTLRRAVPARRR